MLPFKIYFSQLWNGGVSSSQCPGRDEFWWNLGHSCDAVASFSECLENLTMKAFMKEVKKIIGISQAGGWLAEDSLYTQPVSRRKLFKE